MSFHKPNYVVVPPSACFAIMTQIIGTGDESMPRGSPRLRTSDKKMNQLGLRVKNRRHSLKLTQDALCAILARVTNGGWIPAQGDIYRIENGSRIVSDVEIFALAEALECSPVWLLIGERDDLFPRPLDD